MDQSQPIFTDDHFADDSKTEKNMKMRSPMEHGDIKRPSSKIPGRKQLPTIPDQDAQNSLANKMAGMKSPTLKGNQHMGPICQEYSLVAEYTQLQKQKLPGIYVMPSAISTLHWNGVLFIRQGLYQEGVFRFSLVIPEKYPDDDCPRLIFDPPIFHPVIDPESGELDVKRAFPKWRRNVNHIWQVLLYARRVFYKIDTKTPKNPEAAVLYEQNLELYKNNVADSLKKCRDKLYEPPITDDPHAIRFSPWDPSIHETEKDNMLLPKSKQSEYSTKNAQTSGLSWVKEGSASIFTREDAGSA